ncbi:MAG: hypothetical protein H6Q05_2955, partial [Acidobacteria bacterium]|nr:hypothetical protein [Acidobacteriota bacterium]
MRPYVSPAFDIMFTVVVLKDRSILHHPFR